MAKNGDNGCTSIEEGGGHVLLNGMAPRPMTLMTLEGVEDANRRAPGCGGSDKVSLRDSQREPRTETLTGTHHIDHECDNALHSIGGAVPAFEDGNCPS